MFFDPDGRLHRSWSPLSHEQQENVKGWWKTNRADLGYLSVSGL
jgi:hypothetical protein